MKAARREGTHRGRLLIGVVSSCGREIDGCTRLSTRVVEIFREVARVVCDTIFHPFSSKRAASYSRAVIPSISSMTVDIIASCSVLHCFRHYYFNSIRRDTAVTWRTRLERAPRANLAGFIALAKTVVKTFALARRTVDIGDHENRLKRSKSCPQLRAKFRRLQKQGQTSNILPTSIVVVSQNSL